MTRRLASASVAFGAFVGACAVPPAAGAATAKLYTVSLSGTTQTHVRQVETIDRPDGCTGTAQRTRGFDASTTMSPKASSAEPIRVYAGLYRLRFRAVLSALRATAFTEESGGWAVDPNNPPYDPSVCTFNPQPRQESTCTFARDARSSAGAPMVLWSDRGRFKLYFNRNVPLIDCEGASFVGELLGLNENGAATKLSVSGVRRLGKGRSASASGTVNAPPSFPQASGGSTLTYKLKVKRIR